jgi:hypothetical protein
MPTSKYSLPTTYLYAAGFFFRSHNSTPSQEIRRILGNPMIHYRIYNSPLVPVPSQINPVYTILSTFLKVHIKIIFPLTHMCQSGPLPSGFPMKTIIHLPINQANQMHQSLRFIAQHVSGILMPIIRSL